MERLTTCVILVFLSIQADAQMAKDKCKFLGNIVAGSVPSDFNKYWNQVTPENGGKWGSVEATRDVMNWNALDIAYNYAKDNDLPFKQHTLVWGQQQPDWMGALPLAEQKEEVDEWIKAFCERYPETNFIDVVNEPLHAVPNYAAGLGGNGATGWDWVVWAFEKARQYCPNAKLALNDYNIVSNDGATGTYLNIINLLKERDLIDIVGEQGHFMETTPSATIKKNLDRLHTAGLPIHISEYDVNLADDNAQNQKYREQFPVLWEHPGVHGVTLWGYQQNRIWRENAYLIRSDGSARPALTWLTDYVEANKGG
jgi:endo-1,4-beta-xylanase